MVFCILFSSFHFLCIVFISCSVKSVAQQIWDALVLFQIMTDGTHLPVKQSHTDSEAETHWQVQHVLKQQYGAIVMNVSLKCQLLQEDEPRTGTEKQKINTSYHITLVLSDHNATHSQLYLPLIIIMFRQNVRWLAEWKGHLCVSQLTILFHCFILNRQTDRHMNTLLFIFNEICLHKYTNMIPTALFCIIMLQ